MLIEHCILSCSDNLHVLRKMHEIKCQVSIYLGIIIIHDLSHSNNTYKLNDGSIDVFPVNQFFVHKVTKIYRKEQN